MADHVRQQIREAAVQDLTGLTTTGSRVFTGRTGPLTGASIPGLVVRLREESSGWDAAGMIARRGQLIIEGVAEGFEDEIEEILDTIAAEVETALYGGSTRTLDDMLQAIDPPTTQIDIPEAVESGALRVGFVRLLIPVTYRTALSDPTEIV